MHVCDDCFVMNTADGNNTLLTSAILNNGLKGRDAPAGYTFVENNVGVASFTKMAVSDDFATLLPDAIMTRRDREIYPPSVFRSIRLDCGTNFTDFQMDISARSAKDVVVFGLIKFEPLAKGAGSGNLYDIWRFSSQVNGDFAVMQMIDGTGQGNAGYCLNIESSKPATPTHSFEISITPGGTYWCCMMASGTTGKIYLGAWDATYPYAQIGSTLIGTCWTGADSWGDFRCGNDETQTAAGKFLYFKGVSLDMTTPRFPVLPVENNAHLANFGVRPASFKPGIGR